MSMFSEEDEGDAFGALFRASAHYGKRPLSINRNLRDRSIPLPLKIRYVAIMKDRYPTSNFNFVIRSGRTKS